MSIFFSLILFLSQVIVQMLVYLNQSGTINLWTRPETKMVTEASTNMAKPKLIVFDLDYTLWPFWVNYVVPPFSRTPTGIVDSTGRAVPYYPEVPDVLRDLHKHGFILAVASRTAATDTAKKLLQSLDWDKYFTYKEIYPGGKSRHFEKLRRDSGVGFSEMLFFDDEHRNIRDLNKIGVTSILVKKGINMNVVLQGFNKFAKEHR